MGFISERINRMAPSETLAMSNKSNELKAQGKDVINLAVGEPDFNTPEVVKTAAKVAIDKNFSHYPPVPGYMDVREAIAAKLKRDNDLDYKANQIMVSAGGKHALMNCLLATVNPGDEVIIPAPYWVSYPEMVRLVDGVPVFVKGGIETDFKVTAAQIEKAITPKTKVLIMNSPSNPTGGVYTPEEIKDIAAVVAKHPQLIVISDEIYELIIFEGKYSSLAQYPEIKDRVIVMNGVSKGFAMTGWRIGYTASSVELAGAMNKVQGQMTSAASSIAQRATLEAMLQDPTKSEDLKTMTTAFRERRDNVLGWLGQIPGLKLNKPSGAFYIFVNMQALIGKKAGEKQIKTGADFADYLLDNYYVALVGGDAFGDPECFRISYATDLTSLKKACDRIKEAVESLK